MSELFLQLILYGILKKPPGTNLNSVCNLKSQSILFFYMKCTSLRALEQETKMSITPADHLLSYFTSLSCFDVSATRMTKITKMEQFRNIYLTTLFVVSKKQYSFQQCFCNLLLIRLNCQKQQQNSLPLFPWKCNRFNVNIWKKEYCILLVC